MNENIKTYNKLVRDKIPKIIENSGRKCKIKIVNDDEAIKLLIEKIKEEVEEFSLNESKEELADLFEILFALCDKKGWKFGEIEKIRIEKREKRGGFDKNIFLIDTFFEK